MARELDEFDFERLSTDEMAQIQQESILGQEPSIRSEEALRFRQLMDEQHKAIRARGQIPAIPGEWPGGGPAGVIEGAPAVILPRPGEVEVSNLERSLHDSGPCCPGEKAPSEVEEKAREVVKSIFGTDRPSR